MKAEAEEIRRLIERSHQVVVISHKDADGDTLGSALAMAEVVRVMGKQVATRVPPPVPQQYHFLPGFETVNQEERGGPPDLVLVVDASNLERLSDTLGTLPEGTPIVNIDHHVSNTRFGTLNLVWGVTTIVIPLIVLQRLHGGPALVGLIFAVQGLGGVVSSMLAGRIDTRGRELRLMLLPMLAAAVFLAVLLPDAGLAPVVLAMALFGLVNGPVDVAMFTLRQRRTDPAWMGRAFAVSMSFNYLGFPIGTGIAGLVANVSLDGAIFIAIGASVLAAMAAVVMIPRD